MLKIFDRKKYTITEAITERIEVKMMTETSATPIIIFTNILCSSSEMSTYINLPENVIS